MPQSESNVSKREFTSVSIPVLAAAFCSSFITVGVLYSFGVYQQFYVNSLHLGNASQVSVVGSIALSSLCGFGLACGLLAERIGYRLCAFLGAAIMGSGLILASFSSELWHFIITQGLLVGFGSALAYYPILAVVTLHFDKKRGLAVGLAVSGAGIGGVCLSLVTERLLESIGLVWTLRASGILSFCMDRDLSAAVVACASYFMKLSESRKAQPRTKFRFDAIQDIVFWLIYLMAAISSFGFLVPLIFASLFATSIGLTSSQGAIALALFNSGNFVGRVAVGSFSDSKLGSLNSLILCFFLSGTSITLIWPFIKTFELLCFWTFTNGIFAGGIFSLPSNVLADIFGIEGIASLGGLLFTAFAWGNAAGSPFAGIIFASSSGNWTVVALYAGLVQIFACGLGVIAKLILLRRKRIFSTEHNV